MNDDYCYCYRYIVAYRDRDGSDFEGKPWLDWSTYSMEDAEKRAKELKFFRYTDIHIVRIPFIDEITWDYVKNNTVLEV